MIDIIIPAYNAHKTIVATLASILTQTLIEDIKVTIIDDCSDEDYKYLYDSLGVVMDLELIRLEENSGPGACRRIGLEKTDGEYVAFVDADDVLLSPNSIEFLYDELVKKKADVVSGSFLEETKRKTIVRHEEDMVWVFAKLYKRNFLDRKQITFNNTRANEDAGFNYLVKLCTDRICYVQKDIYLWRYHPEAITKIDNSSYSNNESMFGLLENRHWAFAEAKKRLVIEEKMLPMMVESLILFYATYIKMGSVNKERRDEYRFKVKLFFLEIVFPLSQNITDEIFKRAWEKMYSSSLECKAATLLVPDITFGDFINKIKIFGDN